MKRMQEVKCRNLEDREQTQFPKVASSSSRWWRLCWCNNVESCSVASVISISIPTF